ncbi:DUF3305 domain-containing protein [Spiribacter halobius]|nr:DUF3305 domain-containing protein [Spiribacter halobius]UEX78125.1 DUF3305 domain-containing protein [Spiribacter halobius]
MSDSPEARTVWPVTVILTRELRQRGPWQFPAWSVAGVLARETAPGVTRVHPDDRRAEFVWGGLSVQLVRSNAETYWFNLKSERPSLFVVCREDPANGLMPVLVTLDHDEASRQGEGDGEVFAVEFPGWLEAGVREFIARHYRPAPPRKRKPREEED